MEIRRKNGAEHRENTKNWCRGRQPPTTAALGGDEVTHLRLCSRGLHMLRAEGLRPITAMDRRRLPEASAPRHK